MTVEELKTALQAQLSALDNETNRYLQSLKLLQEVEEVAVGLDSESTVLLESEGQQLPSHLELSRESTEDLSESLDSAPSEDSSESQDADAEDYQSPIDRFREALALKHASQ